MILETIVVGALRTNCYLVGDPDTREAVVIDPGDEPFYIKGFIEKNNLIPTCIINTHGHADHIAANNKLNLPILIHKLDSPFLSDPEKNFSALFGIKTERSHPSRFLEDGDKINVGKLMLDVIHTPGHTPGSISLRYEDMIFTGDALFCGGIGRTDFPYASYDVLIESIKIKLLSLPDNTTIYPGHGPPSTIGRERRTNPFLL